MAKKTGQTLCKNIDRYGNPVTLTYNKQKKFPTSIGGIFSFLSAVFITYWLVVACLQYIPYAKYVLTT